MHQLYQLLVRFSQHHLFQLFYQILKCFIVNTFSIVNTFNTSINRFGISNIDRFFTVFSLFTITSSSDQSIRCGLDLLISFRFFLSRFFNIFSTLFLIFLYLNITGFQYLLQVKCPLTGLKQSTILAFHFLEEHLAMDLFNIFLSVSLKRLCGW